MRVVEGACTVVIDRSPEDVYAYLADAGNASRWQDNVREMRQSSGGAVVLGTTYTEVRRFLGQRIESTLEVTVAEFARELSLRVRQGPVPFEIHQRLEPVAGGTRLRVAIRCDPGVLLRLAEPILARSVQRELEGSYASLKVRLEADPGSPWRS